MSSKRSLRAGVPLFFLRTALALCVGAIVPVAHAQYGKGPGHFGNGRGRGGGPAMQIVRPDLPQGWIDTHVHVRASGSDFTSALNAARPVMDRAGIAISIVMPQPYPQHTNRNKHDFEALLPAVKANAGRFLFLGGGGSLNGMIQHANEEGRVSPGLLRKFDERAKQIADAGAAGYGEFAVQHDSLFPGHPYESVPADHPLFLRLADIAAERGMPIDVHMDVVAEDAPMPPRLSSPDNPSMLRANVPAFERLLEHNPNARIVLAHVGWDITGQWSTEVTRALLARHPNLYMSIKISPRGVPEHNPLTRSGIKQDWLALLQQFPDRFLIGSDTFYADGAASGAGPRENIQLAGPSTLLARLPKDIAIKVGYENALRLYRH